MGLGSGLLDDDEDRERNLNKDKCSSVIFMEDEWYWVQCDLAPDHTEEYHTFKWKKSE